MTGEFVRANGNEGAEMLQESSGNDVSTAKTFAPTSSLAATRLVLGTHVILKWHLCFLDIKDAFLLVDQMRLVLVEQPEWWKPEEKAIGFSGQRRYWTLAKCLPLQPDGLIFSATIFETLAFKAT